MTPIKAMGRRRLLTAAALCAMGTVTLAVACGPAAAAVPATAANITARVGPALPTNRNVYIINVNMWHSLSIVGDSTANGALVEEGAGSSSIWYGNDYGTGGAQYKFQNVHSGKCLDVVGPSNGYGVGIDQWDCTPNRNSAYQVWKTRLTTTSVPDLGQVTGYEIYNSVSGLCLDIRDYNPNAGALLQQYPCYATWNQVFYIEPA